MVERSTFLGTAEGELYYCPVSLASTRGTIFSLLDPLPTGPILPSRLLLETSLRPLDGGSYRPHRWDCG
jgi:hypothetical protein